MKLYLLFVVLLSLHLAGCDNRSHEEKQKERYAELMDCKPEKPLSKGELYERAMQDYWNTEMSWVWDADEALVEDFGYQEDDIATKVCGLTRTWLGKPDKITNDRCYPWKVTAYEAFSDLQKGPEHPEKSFTEFIQNRGGIVYYPDRDPPLYKAEFYNKDVDFSVVHAMPTGYWVYPKDCCNIMTYKEVLALKEQFRDTDSREAWVTSFWNDSILSIDQLKNNYFLVTKFFTYREFSKKGYSTTYFYSPITNCGKLIN